MSNDPTVHYEIFVRTRMSSPWTLDGATERRAAALESARELVREGRAVGAKVTKETFDAETREFRSVVIETVGSVVAPREKPPAKAAEPLCVTAQDLYTLHARDRIGRLLDGWLDRRRATPFELLHRADLVEQLESSGTDLQHAIQKIAIPEAQARGASVHEIIRAFHSLVERAIERLLRDARRGAAPKFGVEGFAAVAARLAGEADGAYLLGIGVAAHLGAGRSWGEKIEGLLQLADAAPAAGPARDFALTTLAQPLTEILERKAGLDDLVGADAELGDRLAVMIRLALNGSIEELTRVDRSLRAVVPELQGGAQRLAAWLARPEFAEARRGLLKRILRQLREPRRLKPDDPVAEIALLRALATCLAAAGDAIAPADLHAAISARSRMLVSGAFLDAYLGQDRTVLQQVEATIWLMENVLGEANKREAARTLQGLVCGYRFENEMLGARGTPAGRLSTLAALQRRVGASGLAPEDGARIRTRLGELGGAIEAQANLALSVARAQTPLPHRLNLLLQLSNGEAAPLGQAAARARAEAVKLLRNASDRAELLSTGDGAALARALLQPVTPTCEQPAA